MFATASDKLYACRAVTADTKLALHRSYRGAISVQSQPSVHQAAAKAFIDPDLRLPSKQAFHSLFCIMATLRLLSRLGRGRQAFALLLLLKTFIAATSEKTLDKSKTLEKSEINPVFRLGSGASGPIPGSNTDASQEPRMLTGTSNVIANVRGLRHRRESGHAEAPATSRSIKLMSPIFCMGIICLMMPGYPSLTNGNASMSNSHDFNCRTPP